jgi:hypothetical protein
MIAVISASLNISPEGRHRAFLPSLDPVAKEFIVSLGVHQLRASSGDAAAIAVAQAAIGREQYFDIEGGLRGRRHRLLRQRPHAAERDDQIGAADPQAKRFHPIERGNGNGASPARS